MSSVVAPFDQANVYAPAEPELNPIYAFGLTDLAVDGVSAEQPDVPSA